MEAFPDRLIKAIDCKGNPVVVGIDPRLDLLPARLVQTYFARHGQTHEAASMAIRDYNLRLLDGIAPHVPAVKIQVAFYEAFGPSGMRVFADTLSAARQRGLVVIADVKRGDIEMTAQAYAAAYLASSLPSVPLGPGFDADAITVNPYVGGDGVLPFVNAAKTAGKGLFILVKTSNPTSGDIQNLLVDGRPLYERLAELVQQWGQGTEGVTGYQAVGAVVGATYPAEAARLRGLMPHTYFLVPGYGAQGAGAADVQACFNADGYGAIINSSRAIMYAYRQPAYRAFGEERYPEASRAAILAMREELAAVLRMPS
ncbi:MAG TPA: orotidine-5'-phosphate decarboxylase [Candidatus Tectomicrobia bacterium]|jgi:orotidine-5'-phosphate decarboxylase|nr:orotidine-5'-phosphate decarboxylase [Candidatus Tectomicrobia bacterium]